MNKIYTFLTVLLVLLTTSAIGQSWTVYEADVLPNDLSIERPYITSSGSYNAIENSIIVDPDNGDNNLLQMDISASTGTGQSQFYWRQNFATDPAITVNEITIVVKAKGNPARAMGLDMDIHFNDLRSRVSLFNSTNLADIRTGAGTDLTLGVNVSDWNIYRFTMTATETRLFVNEDADPFLVFTPAAQSPGTNRHFRFGDGDGSNDMGALIDWVIYDVTGSYSPTDSAIPAELADKAPLGDWATYEANELPTDFTERPFETSSGSYNAVENSIIVDADDEENNLLQMDISASTGTGQTAFYWRQRFSADPIIELDELTVVFRAKGNPARAVGLDLDVHFDDLRSRVSLFNGTNVADIRNGTGTDVTLGVNVSDWNIYRFTMNATETRLYVNEEADPVLVFTPQSSVSTNSHFRFGDGDSGNDMGALIDWVVWDVTGAYSPDDTRLPDHLTGGEVVVVPTISAIGTPTALFQDLGFPSANTVESYTVSGSDLTADITITPPANFEVSTDETNWFTNASPLVLTQTDGEVASTAIYVRLIADSDGDYSGDISHTSTDAEEKTVAVSGSTVTLIPEISLTGSLSEFTQNISSPSASQNYRVSGANLKGSVTVTAPTDFEVSTDNSTWLSEITLDPTDRTITNALVYVRLSASALGDYSGNMTHNSTDADEVTLAVSGEVIPAPGINVTGSFTNFSSSVGVPSAPQSYTVSGSNLASGIAITLPEGYEISFTGDLWLSSLTLSPLSGSVATITLYVRLNATSAGAHSGDVVHSSTGLDDVTLAVSGNTSELTLSLAPHAEVMNIWPNPTSSKITFERKEFAKDGKVTLYSLSGTTVETFGIKSGSTILELDVNALPNGLYVIEYQGEENTVRQKFIKN